LFVDYGGEGQSVLELLEGRCFRVHVPCLRNGSDGATNSGAECYLVDGEEFLDERSMLYVPVVNTQKIKPAACEKRRNWDTVTMLDGYLSFFERMGWTRPALS
jgi:hypothetical protein